jgi:hypothetical protein
MSKPLVIPIPHKLGRQEARRRLELGFSHADRSFAALLTIDEETWVGDRLAFRATALGQPSSGTVDVADDNVQLELTLPWLLGVVAEKLAPMIRKETVLMPEKK